MDLFSRPDVGKTCGNKYFLISLIVYALPSMYRYIINITFLEIIICELI